MQNNSNQTLPMHEVMNSLIHGFGILFGLSCLPILITLAVKNNNLPVIVGACVYSFCFLMLFTFSTLYHGFQEKSVKRILKIFDHISIYFLIAGTYTPFLLIYMNNPYGFALLWIQWGLTLFGIFFKTFYTGRYEILSVSIYLLMGWMMAAVGNPFFSEMPDPVLIFFFIGAFFYMVGVIFYLWEKYPLNHVIWHIFVLTAAISHYIAVLLAM